MSCTYCKESLPANGDYATCGFCSSKFHFDECSGLAGTTWASKSAMDKSKWKCKGCRSQNSSRTRLGSVGERQSPGGGGDLQEGFQMIKQSLEKVFSAQFESLRLQINTFQETISESTRQVAELSQAVKNMHAEVKSLKKENRELRDGQDELRKENERLWVQVHSLDQYSRNRNIEFHGIPFVQQERIKDVVQKVFNKLDVNVQEDAFIAHRLPPRDGARAIIVQFESRSVRDEILKRGRAMKLKASDVDNDYPVTPLYINENLNGYYKKLLYDIRKLNVHKGFEYIWCTAGKILVRKVKGSKPVSVKSIAEFEKL